MCVQIVELNGNAEVEVVYKIDTPNAELVLVVCLYVV
jgi:hypothetical protein